MSFLLADAWYHKILATIFALIAVLLMLVILLQRGRGTGLSGAFGGAGGTSATFGSKTGDFLTWVTIAGATVMMVLAVLLNYFFTPLPAGLETTPPPVGGSGTGDGATPPAESRIQQEPAAVSQAPELGIFGESDCA